MTATRVDVDVPFRVAQDGRTATTGYDDHVLDMIEQLLFTRPGERVNRPDYGCGLLDLVFEPNSPELAAVIAATARGALQRWLGDVVTVERLEVVADEARLEVSLQYTVLPLGETRLAVLTGGTGA